MTGETRRADAADFSHVETWIFDLDNTLYPAACNLFALIDARMTRYIGRRLGLPDDEALIVQKDLLHSHGATLSGLMERHGIEPHAFLDDVLDIDLSALVPDQRLAAAIARLPGRKLVHTNGSLRHAERVLERLGIGEHFHGLHDIVATGFRPKPRAEAYASLIARHAVEPRRAAMFEDSARNLEVPHALGMTTVYVAEAPAAGPASHIHHHASDLAGFLGALQLTKL